MGGIDEAGSGTMGKGTGKSRKAAALGLACIPGAGHMYLGMVGKGFCVMALTVFSIFFIALYSSAIDVYWIAAYLVPTVSAIFLAYSIFDVKAALDAEEGGRARGADPLMEAIERRVLFNPRAIGFALVAAGSLGVLNWFSGPIERFLREAISVDLPVGALALPLILLIAGLALILARK
jgi:TM2 domain-containing membrane protein YozV